MWLAGSLGSEKRGRFPVCADGSAQRGAEGAFLGDKCRSPFGLKQGVLSAASCMLVHPRTERMPGLRGRRTAGTDPVISVKGWERRDYFVKVPHTPSGRLAGWLAVFLEAGTLLWGPAWDLGGRERDCPLAPICVLVFSLWFWAHLWGHAGVDTWGRCTVPPSPGHLWLSWVLKSQGGESML